MLMDEVCEGGVLLMHSFVFTDGVVLHELHHIQIGESINLHFFHTFSYFALCCPEIRLKAVSAS
jgi:hypothetical protein